MVGHLVMRTLGLVFLLAFGCAAGTSRAQSDRSAPTVPEPLALELRIWIGQLSDPARDAKTKFEAATMLLTRDHPAATTALAGLLTDSTNRAAGVAVAKAIAGAGTGQQEFVDPLFKMLTDSDPAVRSAAAEALGTYTDPATAKRLIALVTNAKTDSAVRVAAVSTLARIPDKRSVDTLISLLDDDTEAIRTAAAAALKKLTGISTFGADARRWRLWWQENKDKSRQQWLADLANSLARQNAALDEQLAKLRARLRGVIGEWHGATPPANRPALVLALLKDALPEVRLIALELATERVAAGEALAEGTVGEVHALLGDDRPAIRAAAAVLAGSVNGPEAIDVLMMRWESESVASVRTALIEALGKVRSPEATDLLLLAIAEEPETTVIAAAQAIARLAERTPLPEGQMARAVTVISARYGRAVVPELRQALLAAMRALAHKEFIPAMRSALADASAGVRLEAVRGLRNLNDTASAPLIAALVADKEDRGVRQAAIAALGALGDPKHLDVILSRTHSDVESDPTVRQQARETALALLSKTDSARVETVIEALANRDDTRDFRIRLLRLLIERPPEASPRQLAARVKLAETLQAAGRHAEAAVEFGKVYLAAAGTPEAGELWLGWVSALLAADDPACLTLIVEQKAKDAALFAKAAERLIERLTTLQSAKADQALIDLGEKAHLLLADHLPAPQLQAIATMLTEARQRQRQADRVLVAQLVKDLGNGDPAARIEAGKRLGAMQKRAVAPLIEQLRQAVASEAPNTALEDEIAHLLATLAPELTGYDPKAAAEQKLTVLDTWLKGLQEPS